MQDPGVAVLVSWEASLLGLQVAFFSLCLHMASRLYVPMAQCPRPMRTLVILNYAHPNDFLQSYLFKSSILRDSHDLREQRIMTSTCEFSEDKSQPITEPLFIQSSEKFCLKYLEKKSLPSIPTDTAENMKCIRFTILTIIGGIPRRYSNKTFG